MNADETPRLPSPSARLHEVTMAVLTRQPSPPEQSVEVARNARGVVQFTVTARGHDLTEVLEAATSSYDQLSERFPYPATNGGEQ